MWVTQSTALISPSRPGRSARGGRSVVGPRLEVSAGAAASMSWSADVVEVIPGYDPRWSDRHACR